MSLRYYVFSMQPGDGQGASDRFPSKSYKNLGIEFLCVWFDERVKALSLQLFAHFMHRGGYVRERVFSVFRIVDINQIEINR